jgi:hypothetical protein
MDYWTDSLDEMLLLLGSDAAYQERVLTGDLASTRAALKGSRFEKMESPELTDIIAMALVATLRARDAEAA